MSDERANIPEVGEQLIFEAGDGTANRRITLRVAAVEPEGFGWLTLVGWEIGEYGWPVGELKISAPVATIEARRLHRRHRS